jgi:predicted lipoprotein
MKRIVFAAAVLLVAMSVFASNRPSHEPGKMFIATTGRIIRINAKTRTMMIRGAEEEAALRNVDLDDYIVVTTSGTVFQDGGDNIRFEDFKNGETVSIHGSLKGSVLTASRLAKWD